MAEEMNGAGGGGRRRRGRVAPRRARWKAGRIAAAG